MKIVLGLSSLGIGGTESYVLAVAEQLDRLAHQVSIFTPQPGAGAEVARERGIAVQGVDELPQDLDAAFLQDTGVAFEMAELRPAARRVFVAHSESFDPQAPPQLPGVVEAAVALNERVARRLRAFAGEVPVTRLRQPIDTERFLARGALPQRAQRALLLSNNNLGDREAILEAACAAAGMTLERVGGQAGQEADPRAQLSAADVVIGYGRSLLEAMACGRAAFVYDWAGGEGWVTAETYPAIEADGFAGRDEVVLDADGLADSLRGYDRSMGSLNRDLVIAHHRANVHAQQLLELVGDLPPQSPAPNAPLTEMARLVRLEWRARSEVHALMVENGDLRRRVARAHEAMEREVGAAQQREVAAESLYRDTLSWRVTAPLRALGSLLRRLRPRRG
ncbi:MAG TPA: hypothetical protein VFX45_08930 [Solirubrobacterales bacterium]|nr:hypothetical protein [Solirubrobacterales bacterium]